MKHGEMQDAGLLGNTASGDSTNPPSTPEEVERMIVEGMNKLRDQMVVAHRAGREVSIEMERAILFGRGTSVYEYTITVQRGDDEAHDKVRR